MSHGLAVAGLLACAGRARADAAAACVIRPVATLPLVMAGGHALTMIRINGKAVPMVVDTGAGATALDRSAVAGLGLDRRPAGRAILGVGGTAPPQAALTARSVELGRLRLAAVPLLQGDLRLAADGRSGASGVLGADLLSGFDVDFDPARRRLVLNEAQGCAGPYVEAASEVLRLDPVAGTPSRRVAVTLDGVRLSALLDTGASQSLLFGPGIARLGDALRPDAADRPGTGFGAVGGAPVPTVVHRFGALRLGSVAVEAPSLAMIQASPLGLDMLLGLDALGGRRLWISFPTGQLFLFAGLPSGKPP